MHEAFNVYRHGKRHRNRQQEAPFHGWLALLIVQPVDPISGEPNGFPQVAADVLGAAAGMRVLVVSDGRGVQDMLKADSHCPMRLGIMALIDPPAAA